MDRHLPSPDDFVRRALGNDRVPSLLYTTQVQRGRGLVHLAVREFHAHFVEQYIEGLRENIESTEDLRAFVSGDLSADAEPQVAQLKARLSEVWNTQGAAEELQAPIAETHLKVIEHVADLGGRVVQEARGCIDTAKSANEQTREWIVETSMPTMLLEVATEAHLYGNPNSVKFRRFVGRIMEGPVTTATMPMKRWVSEAVPAILSMISTNPL